MPSKKRKAELQSSIQSSAAAVADGASGGVGGDERGADEQSSSLAEGEYKVEAVVDDRMLKGRRHQYQLKWIGYDTPTWEDAANCNCKDLIQAYNAAKANKSKQINAGAPPTDTSELLHAAARKLQTLSSNRSADEQSASAAYSKAASAVASQPTQPGSQRTPTSKPSSSKHTKQSKETPAAANGSAKKKTKAPSSSADRSGSNAGQQQQRPGTKSSPTKTDAAKKKSSKATGKTPSKAASQLAEDETDEPANAEETPVKRHRSQPNHTAVGSGGPEVASASAGGTGVFAVFATCETEAAARQLGVKLSMMRLCADVVIVQCRKMVVLNGNVIQEKQSYLLTVRTAHPQKAVEEIQRETTFDILDAHAVELTHATASYLNLIRGQHVVNVT